MTGGRWRRTAIILVTLAAAAIAGCDYGRMYDQNVVKTYGRRMPEPDPRTVPISDGLLALSAAEPRLLRNPLPYSKASATRGKQLYGYFCVQCHGTGAHGDGTVGQSFAPLPTDLASAVVRKQGDGELYAKIRLGYNRHPRLFATVSEEETWPIVNYIRGLKRGR